MSVESTSVLSPVVSDGNLNLSGAAPEDSPKPGVWDILSVDAIEIRLALVHVPSTEYHVRIAFEDGSDRYVSFNRCFWKESDDFRTYEGVELYDLHLDGLPADASKVDALFEGGIERLENWVWNQEGQE